jgi:hypothetical protein
MTRDELKDILHSIKARLQETAPLPEQACMWGDSGCDGCDGCDVTTFYGVGEEG